LPFNSTHYIVLYPQNGDHIVTVDSVTSLHPMCRNSGKCRYHAAASVARCSTSIGRLQVGRVEGDEWHRTAAGLIRLCAIIVRANERRHANTTPMRRFHTAHAASTLVLDDAIDRRLGNGSACAREIGYVMFVGGAHRQRVIYDVTSSLTSLSISRHAIKRHCDAVVHVLCMCDARPPRRRRETSQHGRPSVCSGPTTDIYNSK